MSYHDLGQNPPQLTWFIDPSNTSGVASDKNSGLDALHPLLTYNGGLVPRIVGGVGAIWNFSSPGPTMQITWMSDQPGFTDPVTLLQQAHDSSMVMTGSLIQVDVGVFGATNNINRAGPQLTTGVNAGAVAANYWTAFLGMLVHDTTTDTWFCVDRDLGAKTAQFTEPFVGAASVAALPNAEGLINPGDAFIIYRYPNVYLGLEAYQAYVDDIATQNVQFIHMNFVTDGILGVTASNLLSVNAVYFLECTFHGVTLLRAVAEQLISYNCYFYDGLVSSGASILGGGIDTFLTMEESAFVDGDCIVHGSSEIWGPNMIGFAYFDTTVDVPFGSLAFPIDGLLGISAAAGYYGGAALWGPAGIACRSNGRVVYDGTAVPRLLCTGPLTLSGLGTGAKITPGAPRVITDGIAITAANIDDVAAGKVAGMLSSKADTAGFFPFA